MRILIDECVDPRIKQLFSDHEVATVYEMGWDAFDDVSLLNVAQNQFDVILTIDRGLEFQQNIARLRLGIVVIHVSKNQLSYYVESQGEILQAIEASRPGQLNHVYCRR